MTYTCTVCSATKTEPIAKLEHSDSNNDGICDDCDADMPGSDNDTGNSDSSEKKYYCKWCIKFEFKKGNALEPIYAMVHAIVHTVSQIFGLGWYA